MNNIVVQPEVIKALADCVIDLIKNIDWDSIDWQAVAEKAVERQTGEWGKWVITEIRCPNCLEYFQTDCYSKEELKGCPICGAIMKEGE